MNKPVKAALLSAFVFPGSGHFFLKKPVQGWLLSSISIVCLYFLMTAVVDIAQGLLVKLQAGEIPFDLIKISELITQQLTESDSGFVNTVVLVSCSVIGVVDSLRIGWSQDKIDDAKSVTK
jgi:TM2 domain-containing membrane protein YozV